MSTPRLDDQLCFALYTASRLVVRAYRPVLEALGLTYPQYLVLLVLWEDDEAGRAPSVGALGERLFLDSGTLTPLLRRLEERGLVRRTRSQADERVVDVHLTAAGRALSAQAACVPTQLLRALGAEADPAALAGAGALRDALRRLNAGLAAG